MTCQPAAVLLIIGASDCRNSLPAAVLPSMPTAYSGRQHAHTGAAPCKLNDVPACVSSTLQRVQVGSDDNGRAVRLKLKHYLAYAQSAEHARSDDAPLYIFDGTFADRKTSRALARDYSVPALFSEDLLQYAGERRRPPYR